MAKLQLRTLRRLVAFAAAVLVAADFVSLDFARAIAIFRAARGTGYANAGAIADPAAADWRQTRYRPFVQRHHIAFSR